MGCINSKNKTTKLPLINLLDNHVLLLIFSHLDLRDRCTLARVCRRWRNLTFTGSTLWKTLDVIPHEINLIQRWSDIKLKFTPALRCLRIGAQRYKSIDCGIRKEVINEIAGTCVHLEELEICGANLGQIDASDLPKSLHRLVISKCNIKNESWFIKAIETQQLFKLKQIDFDFNSYRLKHLTNQFARDLVQCAQNVHQLSLRNLTVGDLRMQELPSSVTELCLWQCNLPRRWFESAADEENHVPRVTKLIVEVLRHHSWTTLCSIGCLMSLVELHIIGADLRALSSANIPSNLQKLTLRQVWLPKRWFRAAAISGNLVKLKYLELTKLRAFSQICASDFRAFTNLKHLNICKSYIDDTGMAYAVGHLNSLECLTITNSSITDVSLALFGEYLSNLKQLRLHNCALITDLGIQCIEDLRESLKLLEIEHCQQLTSDGVVKLASNLSGSLINLNVTSDLLGAENCEVFLRNYDIHLHVVNK